MREILIGRILALATCVGLFFLPVEWARDVTAILPTLIASIYIGFSLGSKGRFPLFKQIVSCIFFIAFSSLGLWVGWWFLVAGLALYGVWDYLHHGKLGRGIVPKWYVHNYGCYRSQCWICPGRVCIREFSYFAG